MLFFGALLSGQWGRFDVSAVSAKSLGGLLYLIFCGSCLGYVSYIWLLNNSSPSPLVAVFLGWLLAGEVLGGREAAATAVIISAVVFLTIGNNKDAGINT
jgi:drug/metabolite transporter (DMT)-like permease